MSRPDEPRARPVVPGWRRWLLGWPGMVLAYAWGVAEGTLFFIVPDLVLTLTALFSARRALAQSAAVVAGSLTAGALLFPWASRAPGSAREAVLSVPFVRPHMAEQVRSNLDRHGAVALLMGPLSGIPYKVYAVEAPGRTSFIAFLLFSIPARFERLLVGSFFFGLIGLVFRRRIEARPAIALAGLALYWIVVYACYWGSLL